MSQLSVIIPDKDNWQQCYQYINFLMNEGVSVLWATEPFSGIAASGELLLDRGTFLIPDTSASSANIITMAQQRFNIVPTALKSVEGFAGLTLKPIRIAMYGGGGAPFNHARIFAEIGFFVDFISPQEIKQGKLSEFDLFGMPGGGGIAMQGQLDPLGDVGCQKIREFVQAGGMYLGSCAGAFDAAIVSDSFTAVCPQQKHMQLINSLVWNRHGAEWVGLNSPGVGVLESRNVQPDHPVMFGIPEKFQITHYNGPFFELQQGTLSDASDSIGLSTVEGFTDDYTPSEYFLRFGEYDSVSQESMLVKQAAEQSRFNIIAGLNHLGRVVLFGSHPEFGYNLAMDRWGLPARMLANAAFWQSGHIKESRPLHRKNGQGIPHSYPLGAGLKRIAQACEQVMQSLHELRQLEIDDSTWLADNHAMSTFGLSGEDIWKQNMATFDDVHQNMQTTLNQAEIAVNQAVLTIENLNNSKQADRIMLLNDTLLGLEDAIHYRTPKEWNQDFGYEGILQMLERTESMLKTAYRNVNMTFEPSQNPYAHFDSSPYQLVVGSYLAAVGVYANCWFLLQVHLLRLEDRLFRTQSILEPV